MIRKLTNLLISSCIIFQILDGVLTGIGLYTLPEGISAEGNPIIRYIVTELGIATGLCLVKGLAIVVLVVIKTLVSNQPMRLNFLILCIFVNIAYLYAVGSWIYLFLSRGGYL